MPDWRFPFYLSVPCFCFPRELACHSRGTNHAIGTSELRCAGPGLRRNQSEAQWARLLSGAPSRRTLRAAPGESVRTRQPTSRASSVAPEAGVLPALSFDQTAGSWRDSANGGGLGPRDADVPQAKLIVDPRRLPSRSLFRFVRTIARGSLDKLQFLLRGINLRSCARPRNRRMDSRTSAP